MLDIAPAKLQKSVASSGDKRSAGPCPVADVLLPFLCKRNRGKSLAGEQRKLEAILFADVVGSPRLMGRGESGTVARLLEQLDRRLAPAAAHCGGRVIRLTGDGGLVEFGAPWTYYELRLSSSKP